jgi:hypothetical protein
MNIQIEKLNKNAGSGVKREMSVRSPHLPKTKEDLAD